jgi:hypothetical protein
VKTNDKPGFHARPTALGYYWMRWREGPPWSRHSIRIVFFNPAAPHAVMRMGLPNLPIPPDATFCGPIASPEPWDWKQWATQHAAETNVSAVPAAAAGKGEGDAEVERE